MFNAFHLKFHTRKLLNNVVKSFAVKHDLEQEEG
jgi:hypothetical protein